MNTITKKAAALDEAATPATKKAAVCNFCGAIYKPDIFERWGREYGLGLGSTPCCEALRSNYQRPIAIDERAPEKAMHPVGVCRGSLSIQDVPADTPEHILAVNDKSMVKRVQVVQAAQILKSAPLRVHLERVERLKQIETTVKGW